MGKVREAGGKSPMESPLGGSLGGSLTAVSLEQAKPEGACGAGVWGGSTLKGEPTSFPSLLLCAAFKLSIFVASAKTGWLLWFHEGTSGCLVCVCVCVWLLVDLNHLGH